MPDQDPYKPPESVESPPVAPLPVNGGWTNKKITWTFLSPSIALLACSFLGVLTETGGFFLISLVGAPVAGLLISAILAPVSTRRYGGHIGYGIFWFFVWSLAQAFVLLVIGFGGCFILVQLL